ncbi:MAG TPA: ATP-binding protein [Acidimicrobiales bacterium]|nr:ATP-binding protein [Acidimicrobiales bacterium]
MAVDAPERGERGELGALAGRLAEAAAGEQAAGDRAAGAGPGGFDYTAIPGLERDGGGAPLRTVLAKWGLAPLLTLATVNAVDNLDRTAFATLAPDIRRTFHLSQAAINGINGVSAVLVVAAAVPFAVLADRGRRIRLAAAAAAVWAVFVAWTGLVTSAVQLTLARVFTGLGQAAIEPVHGSLVADYYPVEARSRAYAGHQLAQPVALVVGPALTGGIAALAAGSAGWRWAFLAVAPLGVVAAVAVTRLRDPERGAMERLGVVTTTQDGAAPAPTATTTTGGEAAEDEPRIPLATGMRRLFDIRTLRYLYLGIGVMGFALVSGPVLISTYLQDQWGVGPFGRGLIFSVIGIGNLVGLLLGGVVGDRLFRFDPSWPVVVIGGGLVAYSVVSAGALYLPVLALVVIVQVVATTGVGLMVAPLRLILAATSPPRLRALSFAMLGIFILVLGGFLGGVIFGAIADATSARLAITLLAVPGTLAGALIALGARHVRGDLAAVAADIREAEESAARRNSPVRNLLEVRNLDFRYGNLQVLFDVSLDVEEGEVLALLGTNGAGKSTLLRAVSGLEHPTRGSIRFDGHDVTYLETEQIVGLGLVQMPGGKAVFPGLTVAENLRAGAYRLRHSATAVDTGMARVEEMFPVLAARRDQLAATLSGGEQQMLGLAKALMLQPRLLCIDELSLGLAPAVIEQLLETVRTLNAAGTTIVIVEQSVNVALSLATRAVFMEKGQVRFSGPARDLLERPDLLRSIFLAGAEAATP